jgi:extradiol dioxygenase family protein
MKAQSIDHFGVILEKAEWLSIAQKVEAQSILFVLSPNEKINDDSSESGKFIIKDPANNLIEFKFYKKSPLYMVS